MHTERTTDRQGDDPAVHTGIHSSPGRAGAAGIRVVVGAAIISAGHVLACARSAPPEVAGMWEFPGGKVEPDETETEALIRECDEELGVRIAVGPRVGADIRLGHGRTVLKVYAARLTEGEEPRALEHSELRWLNAAELDTVAWLPADAPIVAALPPLLRERA